MNPIEEKLNYIIDKSINEMARAKVQRTIDPKLWASVSSSISKKYKNDKGASAKPGNVSADVLVQRLTAALLIMKQPCPRSWYDVKIFPQWVNALQNARTDIGQVIRLYNENNGGVTYREFSVSANLLYSYTSGPRLYSTDEKELTSYEKLNAPSIQTAIQACLKRFWTPENQQWCKNVKSWKTTEGKCHIRITEHSTNSWADITLNVGKEPEIKFEDTVANPKPTKPVNEPEQKRWTIRYEYKDGDEWDTSKEWVYADNAGEARSEFMREHRGSVRIISITEL